MYEKNNVSVSHVTHGPRYYTANKATNYGASGLEVKALGNWKTGDAYSEIYMRSLPTGGMLASAMFNAQKPDEYHLPRAILGKFNYQYIKLESQYIKLESGTHSMLCQTHRHH